LLTLLYHLALLLFCKKSSGIVQFQQISVIYRKWQKSTGLAFLEDTSEVAHEKRNKDTTTCHGMAGP
jgi:hypothetical protein